MKIRVYCLLPFIAVILYGCTKVTSQTYSQLEVGMSFEAAVNLLGNPTSCSEQLKARSCIWGNDKKYIRGTFMADKLVLYSSEGLE